MDKPPPVLRIDAHHHLWRYAAEEFGWLEGELASLRCDHLPNELLAEMCSAGVAGAVCVQARQTIAETEWLLEIAGTTPELLGVVGWLPVANPVFPILLEQYRSAPKLRGLRHVVQAEATGFLDGADFNRGMRALAGSGLVYDILIHQHQLEETIRFVDLHPLQPFVLDHLAKPRIRAGEMEPWATHLRELALRPNVVCKLSGMVTEAGSGWTPEQLKPYLNLALEVFTPARLMVGTDWPVLTAHCGYSEWWMLLEQWIAPLSQAEQAAIRAGTALRTYGLKPPNSPQGLQFA